jgi:hypothetical protein
MINDVLDETGKIMSFQKFQDTYNIQTNFLTYHGVITAISFYNKKSNIPINDLEKLNGPLIPNIIKMFMKSQKRSKDMYHILDSNLIKLKCEEKWTEALSVILNWKEMYRLPFITTKSSKLQWFQYRIIHRILGTNSLLYKINQKPNDKCSFCLEEVETIEHIF